MIPVNRAIKQVLSLCFAIALLHVGDSQAAICNREKVDLEAFFHAQAPYSISLLQSGIEGDVIVQLDITDLGYLKEAEILSSAHPLLTKLVQNALDEFPRDWLLVQANDTRANRQFLIVLRYRMYMGSGPIDYHKKVNKFLAKRKYKQALRYADEAIKDNKYDWDMYQIRSRIKMEMEDGVGATKDREAAERLEKQILEVVDVTAVGRQRTTTERKQVRTSL